MTFFIFFYNVKVTSKLTFREMRSSLVRLSGIRQGNFSNHHIKGIASLQVSAFETNPFKVSTFLQLFPYFRHFRISKLVPTSAVPSVDSMSPGISGFQVGFHS